MRFFIHYFLKKHFVLTVAVISGLCGFLSGFDTSIIAGSLPLLTKQFALSTFEQELVVSIILLGALSGSLFCGRLADSLGRRKILVYLAYLFILGNIITIFSVKLSGIIIGRCLEGLAIGISAFTAPLYISEVAPSHSRGRLVLIYTFSIAAGQVTAYFINYILINDRAWQLMFGIGLLPAFVLLFGLTVVPESPRWLMRQGQTALANKILNQIWPPKEIASEWQAMQAQTQQTLQSWRYLFSKEIRGVLLLGIFLGVFQQWAGINMILYYGASLFSNVGFHSAQTAIAATLVIALVNTGVTFLALMKVDRVGRRPMFLIGTVTAAFSLLFVAENTTHIWLNLLSIALYISGFAISLGVLFWLIISEIYPIAIRGLAMSIVCSLQWCANFSVSVSYLSIVQSIGIHHTFLLFAMINFAAAFVAYFYLPETKQVPLEVIEKNLAQGVRLRYLGG